MVVLLTKKQFSNRVIYYEFLTDIPMLQFVDLINARCAEMAKETFSVSSSMSEARFNFRPQKIAGEKPHEFVGRISKQRKISLNSQSSYDKTHMITMQLPDGKIEKGIVRISDHRVDLGTWTKQNNVDFGISFVISEVQRKHSDTKIKGNRVISVWEYVFSANKSVKESMLIDIASKILDLKGMGDKPTPIWNPEMEIGGETPTEVTNETQVKMKKGDIERMIKEAVLQRTGSVTFKKGELKLREDIKGSIYVSPSKEAGATNDMGNDIQNAMQNNPGQKNFTLQPGDYSTNTATNDVSVDINAQNGSDAENQINQQMKNPVMRSLADQGKLTTNITLNNSKEINDKLKKLEEGVHFKKGELDAFLKSL